MPFDYKDRNIIKLRVDFTYFLSSTIYTKLDELTLLGDRVINRVINRNNRKVKLGK